MCNILKFVLHPISLVGSFNGKEGWDSAILQENKNVHSLSLILHGQHVGLFELSMGVFLVLKVGINN